MLVIRLVAQIVSYHHEQELPILHHGKKYKVGLVKKSKKKKGELQVVSVLGFPIRQSE